jgi:heme A synthase
MTRLHRFAILLAASTVVLVLLGALVTSTGSGLSVATWPSTFAGSAASIRKAMRFDPVMVLRGDA